MANYYNDNTIIYHNGSYVRAADAMMDMYSQSLHYGYSVFEGIRSYRCASGDTRIFKAKEHYDRLQASAEALHLPYSWTTSELIDITYELLKRNDIADAYIRPVVYAPANMSFNRNKESFLVIEAWEMAPFLGEQLLRVMTSTFQRPNPQAFLIHAKAAGHYVNSIMASHEAKDNGYDEALLLDMNGHIAEAPGANMFFEKDGLLYTPALGHILPGITRATVLELCEELRISVQEGSYTREQVYDADAVFFCGTAAEIIGLQSLDEVVFTMPWEETQSSLLQRAYKNLVRENKHERINEVTGVE